MTQPQSLTFLCRFIVLLACLTISAEAFAQHEYRIKLYQHTSSLETVYQRPSANGPEAKSGDKHVTMGTFSLAFNMISLRGNFHHELEIFMPEIKRKAQNVQFPFNYDLTRFADVADVVSTYSFRYEINTDITNVTKRFWLNVGAAVNPYHIEIQNTPREMRALDVERNVRYTGARFNIIPRVSCQLTDRLNLELNIPVNVFEIRRAKVDAHTPNLSLTPQATTSTEHTFFDNIYTVRFGVAYTL